MKKIILGTALLATTVISGCNHPIELSPADDHILELAVVTESDEVVAYTDRNLTWVGELGILSDSIYTFGIEEYHSDDHDDHDHDHDDHLEGDEHDHDHDHDHGSLEYNLELSDSTALTATHTESGFTIHGSIPGTYRIRVAVWHGTHIDLITPWLTVKVEPKEGL